MADNKSWTFLDIRACIPDVTRQNSWASIKVLRGRLIVQITLNAPALILMPRGTQCYGVTNRGMTGWGYRSDHILGDATGLIIKKRREKKHGANKGF